MTATYQPIDCSLHDLLESTVTTRKKVSVVYKDEHGTLRESTSTLKDVYSRSGEEFLVFESGGVIRLDALVSVDGVPFDGASGIGHCGI